MDCESDVLELCQTTFRLRPSAEAPAHPRYRKYFSTGKALSATDISVSSPFVTGDTVGT